MSNCASSKRYGFPYDRKYCDPKVLDFYNDKEELSIHDGIVMKCDKIVVPRSLRSNMLDIIHGQSTHFGVEKSLRRASSVLCWPRISQENTERVLNCPICL